MLSFVVFFVSRKFVPFGVTGESEIRGSCTRGWQWYVARVENSKPCLLVPQDRDNPVSSYLEISVWTLASLEDQGL